MLSIELKAEVDNILRDLHNFLHLTEAQFNNCFIIHSKYFFPTSFPPGRLYLLNFVGLFSAQFQDINTGFFLADTPQKVDNIHREIRFAYSCFPTTPSVF